MGLANDVSNQIFGTHRSPLDKGGWLYIGFQPNSSTKVMDKQFKVHCLAYAFAASLLGLIPFPATADPSTAILQLRADGPNAKRMKARMVNDLTVVRTKKLGLRTSFT